MGVQKIEPYLMFDGTAESAIRLYQKALGAEVQGEVMRFKDVPSSEGAPDPSFAQRVMHARLRIGKDYIMLSDGMPGEPPPKVTNVHVCLSCDDEAEMAKQFEALAEGGQVTMPLQDAFWGDRFGMLKDAFGIHWMFSCAKAAKK